MFFYLLRAETLIYCSVSGIQMEPRVFASNQHRNVLCHHRAAENSRL